MVIGIAPLAALEFTDCLLDTPDFRENLNRHEKELEKTSQQIKRIIKEVKDLLSAAKNLSRAQRTLSKSLGEFNFECIGSTQTDDEQVIADSLKQFGKLISQIEDERDNMLDRAHDQIVVPLEEFRKNHIGGVKENKKKYDKKTAKFCSAQERSLNMSAKKPGTIEADASLGMLEREYLRESLSYVLRIQEVQERIKFEFVETLLGFMSGWLVFYHLGHEISEDAKDYMTDLQHKVQKTRENFDNTRSQAEELKAKYMNSKMKPETEYTKQGYLFLMEKSKLKAFTATWSKYYCTYKKSSKQFTMLQYNQMSAKVQSAPERLTLASCTRRVSEFEKRFCFDLTFDEKIGQTLTLQALSEEDRKAWLSAMDGKEPTYLDPGKSKIIKSDECSNLDEAGFAFVRKCIEVLEGRGLEEEGLYRVGGVTTKIMKLINMGLDQKKTEQERFAFFHDEQHADVLESKTIASALKHYLRQLNEPLMTFRFHGSFIAAAKQETRMQRISDVHTLIYRLPKTHMDMLDIVIKHLKNVSQKSSKNKMPVFNLGVVFGPTLLRAEEETLAAILDIKFNNVVIEILIENYELIFKNQPGPPSEYLKHSTSPPVPSQRNSSNFHRNQLYSQPPVVRVVAKSNYTDPVMSSSLQNIPNGIYVYNQTNGNGKINVNTKSNQHQLIYEQKSASASSSINHSTSSLLMNNQQSNSSSIRDIHLAGLRNTGSTPDPGGHYGTTTTTTTTTSANNGHNNSSPPSHHYRGGDSGSIYQPSNNSVTARAMLLSGGRDPNPHNRETNLSSISRSTGPGEGIYGTGMRLNHPMTSSDTNLSNSRKELSLINDRLHSTSSSNESVCSSSSRDLNHSSGSPYGPHNNSSTQHSTTTNTSSVQQHLRKLNQNNWDAYHGGGGGAPPPMSYSPSLMRDDGTITSQNYIPKKTQRGHKELSTQRYLTSNNLRVRTLYACLAENDGELSFEPNQIITNVRPSNEPGWLDGTLNGKSGLIPENYVEILP